MKLIGLLLLLGLLSLVDGEVIDPHNPNYIPFGNCRHSFINLNNQPIIPTILPGNRQICQRFIDPNGVNPNNGYRYATLYKPGLKIPVYSAYHYTGHPPGLGRRDNWKIEPQLDDNNGGTAMTAEVEVNQNLRGVNQALNFDYAHTGYQKGHLFPHCHSSDPHQSDSSFTLTNAAPKTQEDNTQWYHQVENVVRNNIQNRCQGREGYVVTGVIPGQQWIRQNVNIPTHYWSAFCCRDRNEHLISEGYIKQMNGNGFGPVVTYGIAGHPVFAQMNTEIAALYNQGPFQVFGAIPGCS